MEEQRPQLKKPKKKFIKFIFYLLGIFFLFYIFYTLIGGPLLEKAIQSSKKYSYTIYLRIEHTKDAVMKRDSVTQDHYYIYKSDESNYREINEEMFMEASLQAGTKNSPVSSYKSREKFMQDSELCGLDKGDERGRLWVSPSGNSCIYKEYSEKGGQLYYFNQKKIQKVWRRYALDIFDMTTFMWNSQEDRIAFAQNHSCDVDCYQEVMVLNSKNFKTKKWYTDVVSGGTHDNPLAWSQDGEILVFISANKEDGGIYVTYKPTLFRTYPTLIFPKEIYNKDGWRNTGIEVIALKN